jgi:hypothetical protein
MGHIPGRTFVSNSNPSPSSGGGGRQCPVAIRFIRSIAAIGGIVSFVPSSAAFQWWQMAKTARKIVSGSDDFAQLHFVLTRCMRLLGGISSIATMSSYFVT